MKKRVIISIFLTIFFTGLLNSLYLIKTTKSYSFKIDMFIIVIFLLFLLMYKISDWLADFKTLKNQSRTDIVFLFVFFVLLFVPMSHINSDKISKLENRKLAEPASLTVTDMRGGVSLNYTFGRDFENWFNDRFNTRELFQKLNMFLKYHLNSNYYSNGTVTLYKKGNLMYKNGYWGLGGFGGKKEDVLKVYADNLNKFNGYCEKNGIKLYLLIIPRPADFFDYRLSKKTFPDKTDEVISYLKENSDINVIYPKEEMLEANRETPVYFKTDHHWTKKGTYVSYLALMKQIKKDFPSAPVLNENELEKYYDKRVSEWWNRPLNNGQSFAILQLPDRYADKILDTQYLYYKNPKSKDLKSGDLKYTSQFDKRFDDEFYYDKGADKRVMLIGNSFTRNFAEFLPYSFKYTLRLCDNYRRMKFSKYKKSFDEFKPDIIVINIDSVYTGNLLNLYPNKYEKKGEE